MFSDMVSLDRSEAQCLENCVDRFLDSSLYIVRQIEAQKQQM